MSERGKLEFIRYKLQGYQQLVGSLQIAGSTGLIIGLWMPPLGFAASLGLALMMVFGLIVRIRLHDSFIQMVPAIVYLLLNGYLAASFFTGVNSNLKM
ncbi:MAG: hypothetical protein HC898_09430 [Phycisphaerales bacterium]|nr:hypothetical protein [Phycisphaerales bacterium]